MANLIGNVCRAIGLEKTYIEKYDKANQLYRNVRKTNLDISKERLEAFERYIFA